ncbi:MAG TPA: phosphatase PAP2 family protein [Saprospiraceae bacterium]|nr:phosphatase PAP2 family protein [Saprospiraceae bacterium]
MMDTWLQWDTSLFHWINSGWSNGFFDWLFPLLRNKYLWLPLYIFCLAWILFNFTRRQTLIAILFTILSIFASDTISSKLIKNNIHRQRPCQVEAMVPPVIERVPCGSGYSFTSSHASNHFCLAAFAVVVFGHFMGRWRHLWWAWALLISLSQVYVGLHYPGDIAGGALLGTIVGISMGTICKHYMKNEKLKTKS